MKQHFSKHFLLCAVSFSQVICDNADHNVNIIDGLHAVHIMRTIQCVSPYDAVLPEQKKIVRLTTLPSAEVVGKVSSIVL